MKDEAVDVDEPVDVGLPAERIQPVQVNMWIK